MTGGRELGRDVNALIHHIELNESGWMDRALGRAVKFLIWLYDRPLSISEVISCQKEAGLDHLTKLNLQPILDALVESAELLLVSPDTYRVPESERKAIEASVEAAERTEEAVKKRLLSAITKGEDVELENEWDQQWGRFHGNFIVPFIQEAGARAYELITGNAVDGDGLEFISDYTLKFPENERADADRMMRVLFDRQIVECRTYVLRLLNSYFFERATRLPSATAQKVFGGDKTGVKLRFLLDTNFLFSLLELHANPSNEAVKLLIQTIKRIPNNINVGLYVLPETIDEFRRALTSYEYYAAQIRVTKNIIEAGIKAKLSGVIETYLERCKESKYSISPDEYFSPFHENITAILKEKGVEILRSQPEKYNEDQRVIDDTLNRQAFYKQRYINEPQKQKKYEQIWHDVLLWYVIHDRRPAVCDTFFDADWIGVTIDYSLLAFDSRKRGKRGIPCMVHPAALVQALQIIVPNDENLESALISSMQLPFLFDEFDIEDERATQKILGLLSRYEHIEDLSVNTISQLLGDRALKGKIQKSDSQTEELALIEEALVEHAVDMEKREQEAIHELEQATKGFTHQLKEKSTEIEALQEMIETERAARAQDEKRLLIEAEARESAKKRSAELENKLGGLEKKLISIEEESKRSNDKRKIFVKVVFLFLLMGLSVFFIYQFFLDDLRRVLLPLPALLIVCSPIPLFLRCIAKMTVEKTSVQDLFYIKAIGFLDKWFWWFYGFVLLSVLGPFFWEQFTTPI